MEEEGRTIFLPKGHFFSLWLTLKDGLKGSIKYHSATHSARAPRAESREGPSSKQKRGPECLSTQSSLSRPDQSLRPSAASRRPASGMELSRAHLPSPLGLSQAGLAGPAH